MSGGMWVVVGLLLAAFGGFIAIWTRTEPEVPDGVRIEKIDGRWTYFIEDSRAMYANITGYLTRASAIRAARTELDRLEKRTKRDDHDIGT
jgi:hypothetical protein